MARPAGCFYWKSRCCFATDAGGKRRILVKGANTKANRELALQKLADVLRSRPSRPVIAPSDVTLEQLIDWFFDHCDDRMAAGELKPNTVDGFYKPHGRLVRKERGHWRADRIDKAMILAYRRDLNTRSLSPTTIKNRLATLRAVLRWAKDADLISTCPPVPTGKGRRREHIPTEAELEQLIAAARPDVADVLLMLTNCAVRPGDIFALRRSWVDIEAGLLRLTDSKRGQRLVPIGQIPAVIDVLTRRLSTTVRDDDFVFTTVRGCPWHFRYFGEQVRKARQLAGLGKHCIAYSCRHYWTTQALLNRVPIEAVGHLRGDANISTTMIYVHLARQVGYLQQAARQAVGLDPDGDD